jgi:hypothetical protein
MLKGLADRLAPSKTEKNRQLVFKLAEAVMKTAGIKEEYGIGPVKYNVLHKLQEELDKLPDETVEKVLSEVKRILSEWVS